MVEEDQYCVDVLTQLSAIIAGARAAGLLVLDDHIRGCVLGTCRHGHEDQEEVLNELTEAIALHPKRRIVRASQGWASDGRPFADTANGAMRLMREHACGP